MNTEAVGTGSAVERVKEGYGTLHASDKLEFINSVLLVAWVVGPLLLFSSFIGVLTSMTSGLSIARGAQTPVEAMSIQDFKRMTPAVGTRVRLSDADLSLSSDRVQKAQTHGYATVLAVPVRRETGDSDESSDRVVFWEAPLSLIAASRRMEEIVPSPFEEARERTGVPLDGVVTDVTEDSIYVMDLSRVPTVFQEYMILALWAVELLGGVLLMVLVVRLRRTKRLLKADLQQSRPLTSVINGVTG